MGPILAVRSPAKNDCFENLFCVYGTQNAVKNQCKPNQHIYQKLYKSVDLSWLHGNSKISDLCPIK